MKNPIQFIASVLSVCVAVSFISFSPTRAVASVNHITANSKHAVLQHVKPASCTLTNMDHEGHRTKMTTDHVVATPRSITITFDDGEVLIFNFQSIRTGHFAASAGAKRDPEVLYYKSHNSRAVVLLGIVTISGVKPISGSFSSLSSQDADPVHLILGSFNL